MKPVKPSRPKAALRESEERVQRKLQRILSPASGLGQFELSDLIDVGAIQLLTDKFCQLARVPNAITDLKGNVWNSVPTPLDTPNIA